MGEHMRPVSQTTTRLYIAALEAPARAAVEPPFEATTLAVGEECDKK